MMKFYNEAGLVNFVCIVFELGDKMLTLSSMENLIVQCNLDQCQEMTLTFNTHLLSFTELVVCIYKFSGHWLQ